MNNSISIRPDLQGYSEDPLLRSVQIRSDLTALLRKQSLPKKGPCVAELPSDVEEVMFHDRTTIVKLTNGKKAHVTCHEPDTYDPVIGFKLAYHKAKNTNHDKRLREIFNGCLERKSQKGYKVAILKNYK